MEGVFIFGAIGRRSIECGLEIISDHKNYEDEEEGGGYMFFNVRVMFMDFGANVILCFKFM